MYKRRLSLLKPKRFTPASAFDRLRRRLPNGAGCAYPNRVYRNRWKNQCSRRVFSLVQRNQIVPDGEFDEFGNV